MKTSHRLALMLTTALVATVAQVPGMPASIAGVGSTEHRTSLVRWRASDGGFSSWTSAGAVPTSDGTLQIDQSTAVPETDPYSADGYLGGNYYNAGSYVVGRVASPVMPTEIGFSEAIASWNAQTPPGTWIETLIRARVDGGRFTKLYNLGIWASDSATVERHSVRAQGDADGFVAVDTLILDKKLVADAFQLELRLFSAAPGVSPTVRNAFVVVSTSADKHHPAVPGDPALWDRLLPVPECSQMVYPDGGTVWCSPTSTSMVMAYWAGDTGPCEPRVRAAVAGVHDWVYDGDGNWPFNTAYAATAGLEAHVARFTSMADVEPWIAAGVPVVVSYYWKRNSWPAPPSRPATATWRSSSASTPTATRS